MLAATIGANFLGNMLTGRGMKSKIQECRATIPGVGVIQAGEDRIRASKGTTRESQNFLLLPHPLSKSYQKKFKFNGQVVKNNINNSKIATNPFLFLLIFHLISSRHSHNYYI